jgi:hypothetical protein
VGSVPPDFRDTLVRVVRLQEAIADGECDLALAMAEGLGRDLAAQLEPPRRRLRCDECGFAVEWPGELDEHVRWTHGQAA